MEGLQSIVELAANSSELLIYSILDLEDSTMSQEWFYSRIESLGEKYRCVRQHWGQSKSKIHAINRPEIGDPKVDFLKIENAIISWLEPWSWDILVNFSDDMRFVTHGWDQLIREAVRSNGPDAFLHFPDSTAKHMLPTMSVMDRTYYERDKFIYYPEYWSVFCDNEAMEVAKKRGRYFYIDTQIHDHFHPAYGHVPWDEQYARQQAMWNHDEDLFRYRQSNNFFLDEHGNYTFVKYSYPDDKKPEESIQSPGGLPTPVDRPQ